jgi:hypothetical protein
MEAHCCIASTTACDHASAVVEANHKQKLINQLLHNFAGAAQHCEVITHLFMLICHSPTVIEEANA